MKTSPMISSSVRMVGFLNSRTLPSMVLINDHSPFFRSITTLIWYLYET